MNEIKKILSRLVGEGSGRAIEAGIAGALENAAEVLSVKAGDAIRFLVTIQKVSAFHGINFDLVLPDFMTWGENAEGGIPHELGNAFENYAEGSVDKAVNRYPDRAYVSLSVKQGADPITATDKTLIALYATVGEVGPGSEGLVQMRNVKAVKWDNSELGFSEVQSGAVPLSVIYESPSGSSEIILKIVAEKV